MNQNTSINLALVVTTHNSIRTISRCLESVRGLVNKIYVVDSGSTDGTLAVCEKHGAEVVHKPWRGFAKQKEFAISLAQTEDWVLLLDSDESLEPSLQQGLRLAISNAAPATRAIEINRKMWYVGDWINHVGFPDWVVRCGRQGALRMIHKPVHERLEADGPTVRAMGICRHDSWDGICDALERGAKYARLSAEVRKPKKFPLLYSFFSVLALVFKYGIVRRGFLDGWRGTVAIISYSIGKFANTMAAFERSKREG